MNKHKCEMNKKIEKEQIERDRDKWAAFPSFLFFFSLSLVFACLDKLTNETTKWVFLFFFLQSARIGLCGKRNVCVCVYILMVDFGKRG